MKTADNDTGSAGFRDLVMDYRVAGFCPTFSGRSQVRNVPAFSAPPALILSAVNPESLPSSLGKHPVLVMVFPPKNHAEVCRHRRPVSGPPNLPPGGATRLSMPRGGAVGPSRDHQPSAHPEPAITRSRFESHRPFRTLVCRKALRNPFRCHSPPSVPPCSGWRNCRFSPHDGCCWRRQSSPPQAEWKRTKTT